MVYAPGLYTGYGVKTLPGVREAIEQREWKAADEQIAVLAPVLEKLAESIHNAAAAVRD
jgi:N-acetylated-alpha-linked acidic dipeptidase